MPSHIQSRASEKAPRPVKLPYTRAWSSIQEVRYSWVLGLWYLIFGFFLS